MTYANLLVRMELGRPNRSSLAVTAQLATRFDVRAIGIAVCQPMLLGYPNGYIPETLIEQDRRNIEADMAAAEHEFRTALAPVSQDIAWRPIVMLEPLSAILAREARCADLIITELSQKSSVFDPSRYVDVGDLVMTAGRPCLIVPDETPGLSFDHVVVGWKDTPEARRAAYDAMPLLKIARRVSVVELASLSELDTARARVNDVVRWLTQHGVNATGVVDELRDDSGQLRARLADGGPGLIVAGAYGHSRLYERVFGGVTRNLLLSGTHCALISH